ncbi:UDP-N-acetylmuramate--L-alanine ligase [Desulfurispora thermophila]|uniref:UDP-N-acetylmuramate--L-alanine ligase n=1 Tax=Desulfurispora thermophila TaxID=265470 RepID=UPI0034A3B879
MQIPRNVHFIGIGGAGMSGLAKILLEQGHTVTGSDIQESSTVQKLRALGAQIAIGHRAENIGPAGMVVVSTAIKPGNPELAAAREKNLPVWHRGELLAALMDLKRGVAIAGAHGKTTTTSMLALVLEKNRLDPAIVVGGELKDLGINAKWGGGEYMVAEADESDGSFLRLSPWCEIITNIEDDHLDYYGSPENIRRAFGQFMDRVRPGGAVVACTDDPGVRAVLAGYRGSLLTYGLHDERADYTMRQIELSPDCSQGEVYKRGQRLGLLRLAVPGRHNLQNALGVVAAAGFLGLDFAAVARVLAEFSGAGRRFQLLGEVAGIRVVDDYAHHPSEIAATLRAARQLGYGRVVAVFQPHRYTRTALLKDRFATAFQDADVVIVSDIYSAGENPIPGVNAAMLAELIQQCHRSSVKYLAGREEIVEYLLQIARPGDLILTMGAGNIWQAGRELVHGLWTREEESTYGKAVR